MKLEAGHRKALLDNLNKLKKESEVSRKTIEKARKDKESKEYMDYLEIGDWLIDQQLDLIIRAMIDNEIDY